MKRSRLKRLVWIVFWFNVFCLGAYYHRGDFYHKQADQFFYLSLADSLRESGVMVERIDLKHSITPTVTSGAALMIFPFSKMRVDHAFFCVSLIYLLLNLLSVFPLFRLLMFFELSEEVSFKVLLVFFLSFPITMFKLWPVNEGPSLFLISWYMYLVLVKPKSKVYLPIALIASIFRAHIFYVEWATGLFALSKKKWSLLGKSLFSFALSAGGLWGYVKLFPARQARLANQALAGGSFLKVIKSYFEATTHLFFSEHLTSTIWGSKDSVYSEGLGLFVFVITVIGFFVVLKKRPATREIQKLGLCMFVISSITACLSIVIIARFHTVAFLWVILDLYLFFEFISPWLAKVYVHCSVIFNIFVLCAFLLSQSTDPQFGELEALKKLSEKAGDSAVIYRDIDFPVDPIQIYAYFRRPSTEASDMPKNKKVLLLSMRPEIYKDQFPNCSRDATREGMITLLQFDCRGVSN